MRVVRAVAVGGEGEGQVVVRKSCWKSIIRRAVLRPMVMRLGSGGVWGVVGVGEGGGWWVRADGAEWSVDGGGAVSVPLVGWESASTCNWPFVVEGVTVRLSRTASTKAAVERWPPWSGVVAFCCKRV